jgi:CobQ-like glutamine amidotransferase family enzyme
MFLNIGWLYPDLMSTYGDRGNIIALSHRSKMMGIKPIVNKISVNESGELISKMDIIFMGGAQDKQQEIVNTDLKNNKGKYLISAIENNVPCLFVCGAYQFLGKYYKAADGTMIEGLGAFDLYTENPGLNFPRCIGNIIIKSTLFPKIKLIGFENHGGRTYLADKNLAFAQVVKGFGNNGEDKTEGIFYKNSFGTYLHGPILPKNPELADYLIKKAVEKKYEKGTKLKKINNKWENKARSFVINKL